MSEYAKVAYLQELINQAKRKWNLNFVVVIGLLAVCGIFTEIDLLGIPNWPNQWINALIFAPFIVVAAYSANKAMKQYYRLVEQLKGLAYARVTCSRCKNEMPLGMYEFCPFCGNSLKEQQVATL